MDSTNKLKSALVSSAGALLKARKSPDEAYADLFREVQERKIYSDGKTFADLVPKKRITAIEQEYKLARQDPDFDLGEFVARHFYEFAAHENGKATIPDISLGIDERISELWTILERRNRLDRGSLVALPHAYIVPGGRFSEQFYWDSYFIMLGLAADDRWPMIDGMIKNFAFMIRKFGFIPTANRTYFISRSQPPFFAQMVQLLSTHNGKTRTYFEYLPSMLAEYRWWMRGRNKLSKQEHKAFARVVEMPNGARLNRYYDNKTTPRPESLREDIATAATANKRQSDRLFLHLRAAAESGWDFSSRWFTNADDIRTVHTADIVPVDLNCLLYGLETTIAEAYRLMRNPILARRFEALARQRAQTINRYMWSTKYQFYGDYNFHHQAFTGRLTLAAVYPLFVGIASQAQADAVAEKLEKEFLQVGGLSTTLINSGQQWDAPNGWAPLHWVAIQGLKRYGHEELAEEITNRWLTSNQNAYNQTRKLIEKYNVVDESAAGSGGEYLLQDGFGWTNGVYAALKKGNRK